MDRCTLRLLLRSARGAIVVLAASGAAFAQTPVDEWARDAVARALEANAQIKDDAHRVQSLAEIAQAQIAIGDTAAASDTLDTARELADQVREEPLASWVMHDIAMARLKTGDLRAARAVASTIADARLQDTVLAALADAQRDEGDFEGALQTAREIRNSAIQGRSLRETAIVQMNSGDREGALSTARSIVHGTFNALTLGDVAVTAAREGDLPEARRLAARIRDAELRGRALAEIAGAQAEAGEPSQALATAQEIRDTGQRARAFARIAAALAGADRQRSRDLFQQAASLVARVRFNAEEQAVLYADIARAELSAGDRAAARTSLARAIDAARKVRRDATRVTVLASIAPLQARAHDFSGAFATVARVTDVSLRPLIARDVAAAQTESGDVAGALAAARAMADAHAGAAACLGVLRTLADRPDGDHRQEALATALQIVRKIPKPEIKAAALGSLAAHASTLHYIDAAESRGINARELVNEALAVASAASGPQQRASAYARMADALASKGLTLPE